MEQGIVPNLATEVLAEVAAEATAEILAEVLVELAGGTELVQTELVAQVEIQQLEELKVLLIAVYC
jgi:hypothetical protein